MNINKDKNIISFYGMLVGGIEGIINKIISVVNAQDLPLCLEVAGSESSCIERLTSTLFDIIVIYHHPPTIDALRLMQYISLTNFKGEILVITLPDQEALANQALMKGAFAYFIDTVDQYEALVRLIEKMLNFLSISKKNDLLYYKDKLNILDRFISFIAHELKNPFTTINNALYFLKKKFPENDPLFHKYISIIEQEITSSNKFLSNFINISQRRLINLSPQLINEILEKTVKQFPIPSKINLIFQFDPFVPFTIVDPEQIQFAFLQIIRNAIQAMPEGGNLTIKTLYINESQLIEIHIIDQGIGIEKDHLIHIFEPFFTTKTRNIGLGLTLARIIIETHEGQILISSAAGQGTQCTISLPKKS